MTSALGLNAVAEGVETLRQKEFLAERGCDEFQGYLISPAVPAAEIEAILQAGRCEENVEKEGTERHEII